MSENLENIDPLILNDNENNGVRKITPKVFDPRIIDDTKSLKIWTSESVELAKIGLREGYKLSDNPFLKTAKGITVRKAGLSFEFSPEEKKCFEYCMDDIFWFGNNFVSLKDADKGWQKIKLRDYQTKMLKQFLDHRFSILLCPRQAGKSTTAIVNLVHFMIFNIDKDCIVIAQNENSIKQFFTKVKSAFEALPFFLQPGFISVTDDSISLDNGCRLKVGIAAESVSQGYSLDWLMIDEMSFIRDSLSGKFWLNIYPTLINNRHSRCIIASTPNGRNLFYDIWTKAINKLNVFVPFRLYWQDIPGIDEKFKEEFIANTSEESWEQSMECSFDTQIKSIFSMKSQKYLRTLQLEHVDSWSKDNHPIGEKFDIEFISQKIVQYDLRNDFFIIGIDISEGLNLDESVLKIKKCEWNIIIKKIIYKSIGIFHSNEIEVYELAQKSMDIIKYFNQNNIRFAVENNTFGAEYFQHLTNFKINSPSKYGSINIDAIFTKFKRKSVNEKEKSKFEKGIRWNTYNKKVGVKSFSSLITKKIMYEYHPLSLEQYLNFGRQTNQTFSANYGHDDLVLSDVSISYFITINNIYTASFLKYVESILRFQLDDETEEIKKAKADKDKKEKERYRHGDWVMRDSKEHVNERQPETIMLYDVKESDLFLLQD
jgi:hypothetical protein